MKTTGFFGVALAAVAAIGLMSADLTGQGQGGRGGGRGQIVQAQPVLDNLPDGPTAVTLPTMSAEVTGPGPIFDSAPSMPPGKGLAHFGYEAKEYFISGTANGQPYKTRIVVRTPTDKARFSGLVLAESMHGSGAAHMFEYTSIYTMASGHAAVEILTTSPMQLVAHNQARYRDLQIAGGQANEIIAQAGALVRSGAPLGGAAVRKMVLAGTSMSAGTLINYLPAHMVYRTPQLQRIFDGFMPTSNGATIREIDVPIVHVPTMHEVTGNITRRQDSDEAGKQYRLYEFAGMAHIDSRDNARLQPNPCTQPVSTFPLQAYMSVALNHLFQWVDKGVAPPRADRVWLDLNEEGDGSMMVLDEHGNPRGGIRNPYVDVPTAKYVPRATAATPLIASPSAYIAARGEMAASQMCGLGSYQVALEPAKLKQLYGSKRNYVSRVERRVSEMEKAGWSLPVYRELILADAAKITF
jgi:hypothetical protein